MMGWRRRLGRGGGGQEAHDRERGGGTREDGGMEQMTTASRRRGWNGVTTGAASRQMKGEGRSGGVAGG